MVGGGAMGRAEGRQDQSREECIVPIIAIIAGTIARSIVGVIVPINVPIIVVITAIRSTPPSSAAVCGMERPAVCLQIRQQIGALLLGQWLRLTASTTVAITTCHHGRRLRELRGGIILSVGVGGEGPAQ